MNDTPRAPLLFGGPDRPARALRDRLQSLVDAAPPGSSIDWATYYFRDIALAEALIRAAERGVAVRLVVEARTRRRGANDAVLALLRRHGLHGGLRERRRPAGLGHLHAKIYAFSDPALALVGSFNPSGNQPEDRAVIAEIGDQNRGWNLLYAIDDPAAVAALARHVRLLGRTAASPLNRFRPGFARAVPAAPLTMFFYPRLRTRLVEADVAAARAGTQLLAAVSHLKAGPLVEALRTARRNGADVSLLVHATQRRVPDAVVADLVAAGVRTHRVGDARDAPMHNKFVVLRGPQGARAWLGSYNFNAKSRWLNDELLLRTEDQAAVAALARRFADMRAF